MGDHVDTLLLREARRLVEHELHVLTGIDGVREVAAHALGLVAETGLRHRLVGTDDLQPRIRELGEPDCRLHRPAGGIRAVGSNHYALEHHPPRTKNGRVGALTRPPTMRAESIRDRSTDATAGGS